MKLNPVDSGMIAQVGYDCELKHLRAVMRDGSNYDVAPCTAMEFAFFMDAPSKGTYWHKVFAGRAYRSGEAKAGDASTLTSGVQAGVPGHDQAPALNLREPSPLHHVEDDPCCAKSLRKFLASAAVAPEVLTCQKCGCEWKARNVDGVFHWEPVVAIAIFRR